MLQRQGKRLTQVMGWEPMNLQWVSTPILYIKGLFTFNEIYPVTDIQTSLILY